MRLHGFSREETQWLVDALDLLRSASPNDFAHACSALTIVLPGECGAGALACTAGSLGRAAHLAMDLRTATLEDIAVTISHEARHHQLTDWGWQVVPHTCTDCTDLGQRVNDAIYAYDDVLWWRLRLHRVREAVVPVAGAGAAALLVGALLRD